MDLSLLLPVIGLIFTVVSKLLLLYSTIDKTSTLKMKKVSLLLSKSWVAFLGA